MAPGDTKIKRFYYYTWDGDTPGFDSGLIGQSNKARCLYYDYRAKRNPGLGTSATCG